MLAHRRADVRELNEAARTLLLGEGRLGDRALQVGEREFRAGDRVICRRNDSLLGVCNGTPATVCRVDPVLGLITLQLDAGPIRQLPDRYAAEHLEHGYVLTGHAAQGMSVDRAFVLVRAEGALAEWGYVVASRARSETRLYAVGPELTSDAVVTRQEVGGTAPQLAGALSRSAAEPSAVAGTPHRHYGPSPMEMARDRLRREIASRARLLASAQARLDGLGWIGRRRRGPELREFVAVQHRLLADLRADLRELPTREVRWRADPRERPALPRGREQAARQAPERGMGLEL
jgi:hypothetical protein